MRNGWEYKKLSELSIGKLSYGSGASAIDFNGIVRYIRITDIDDNGDLKENCVSPNVYDENYLLSDGDILFARSGATVGKTYLFKAQNIKCVYAGYLIRFVPNQQIVIPSYVFHYTNSPLYKSFVAKVQRAVAQPNINAKQYGDLQIPIPPKSTQLAIASELDKINELIRLKKEQLVEYDNLAQSIFYEMFGDPVENEKGWEMKKLGDICVFSQGIQIDVSKQKNDFQEGYNRFLRIVDYTTFNTDIRYVPVTDKKYWINLDDIVVVRYGASAGFIGIMKEGILANNLFKISYPRDRLEMLYLFHYLQSGYYKSFIQKIAFGAAMPALSFSSFGKLEVMIPPLPLQQSFASRIEQIEKLKSEVQKAITDLETLLASRMQYWFE